jgi:hypothetical protein
VPEGRWIYAVGQLYEDRNHGVEMGSEGEARGGGVSMKGSVPVLQYEIKSLPLVRQTRTVP